MKIAVGTTNPSKIQAVQEAFEQFFKNTDFEIIPIEANSGISDQPMSDEESLKGAYTRATHAIQATGADYGVGIEGGLEQVGDYWVVGNVAVIVDEAGNSSPGFGAKVAAPAKVIPLLLDGKELNQATFEVTSIRDNGKKEGLIGLMSNSLLTRASTSRDAIILALSGLEYQKD